MAVVIALIIGIFLGVVLAVGAIMWFADQMSRG